MANKRIKDISTASTSFASDDFVITDSATSGTRKMTKDNLISQVSAGVSGDYLEESNNLSDVASKDTAKLNLEVPDIGTAANEVPLNGMLNSGAWLDFDAFYETGTWTPSVSFGGGSTGVLYSVQSGSYTRIGNQVTIHARIDLTSKGSSNGDFRVTGLPFVGSSSAGANSNSVTLGVSKNWSGLTVSPTLTVKNGDTQLYFFLALSTTQVQDTHVSDTLGLRFSGTYQIA